jgi:hypothetical protein
MQPLASAGPVMASSEIAAIAHANVFVMSFSRGLTLSWSENTQADQKFRGWLACDGVSTSSCRSALLVDQRGTGSRSENGRSGDDPDTVIEW